MSSLLFTVAYSIRLYHASSRNAVMGSSIFSRSARNVSTFSLCACFATIRLPTSSSRSFALSNRPTSPSYFAWYSSWSMAVWAFSRMHCCTSPATTFMDLCQYFGQKKSKDYTAFLSSSSSFCCGVM